MKTYIVVAAYNEQKAIIGVVKDLKSHSYKNIIVVDDCSADKTLEVIKKLKVDVLHHQINRGQGAALRTGTTYALQKGANIIVHFDADGQMQAFDIKNMIKPIINHEADIVLGSRFLEKGENIPIIRKLVLKAGILVNILMGAVKTTDSQCGFRAMSRRAAEKIEITQDRMAHASEILEEVKRKKLKFKEVPVTIKYTKYSLYKGQSTSNAVKIFLRLLFNKLIGR